MQIRFWRTGPLRSSGENEKQPGKHLPSLCYRYCGYFAGLGKRSTDVLIRCLRTGENKPRWRRARFVFLLMAVAVAAMLLFAGWTWFFAVQPFPASLARVAGEEVYADILDRHGYLLSLTRQNRLNTRPVPLWQVPDELIRAFLLAEDKRFYEHGGVDWLARGQALWQNLKGGRILRGASTITEQCVRILHPRPRTLYSRWVETCEAYQLEKRFSKGEILEFYLNQVPFSHQCRGIQEASLFYFGRTLDTLNRQEMLTLAVMVRAPGLLQPAAAGDRENTELNKRVRQLADLLKREKWLPAEALTVLEPLHRDQLPPPAEAAHFVQHIKNAFQTEYRTSPRLLTTLDARLQTSLNSILRESLRQLHSRQVRHGALLVLDHQTDEILVWATGQDFSSSEAGSQIDTILAPRQPGSALKPFLYALALERGYTAATILADIPLAQPVGHGLHQFKNYSAQYYGPVRLRCALGNSLNIPAVRTVQALGVESFKELLLRLGIRNLGSSADYYGEGLALGNGEISLYELVRAYAVLARAGLGREPRAVLGGYGRREEKRIFSAEAASLIAHILSDPQARLLEFGESGLLNFPVQTAVKTGTSTGYRDAWAVGFNYRFTAGVWMGNLDYQPMDEISGSRGPALVLRSVFHELTRQQDTRPLFLSPVLQRRRICALSGQTAGAHCPQIIEEWFQPRDRPAAGCNWHTFENGRAVTRLPFIYRQWLAEASSRRDLFPGLEDQPLPPGTAPDTTGRTEPPARLIQPVPDLHIALDPRIPDHLERFPFIVETRSPVQRIQWFLDGQPLAVTGEDQTRYLWPPVRGSHTVSAIVALRGGGQPVDLAPVSFLVK